MASEQDKAALSKKRGQAASYVQDPSDRQKFIAAQGEAEGKKGGMSDEEYQHLDREAEDTIATQGQNKSVGGAQYIFGTPSVSVDDKGGDKKQSATKQQSTTKKVLGDVGAGAQGLQQAMADNQQREAAARQYADSAEARVRSELPSFQYGTPRVSVGGPVMRGSNRVGAASFMPMYKDGTKKVPKKGVAKLHKGEVRVSNDKIKKLADKPGVPGSDAANVPSSMIDRIKAEASRRLGHAASIPSDVGRAAMGALGGDSDEMQAGVQGASEDAQQAIMPQYKDGVAAVPKTGPAIVHEGEAIIPKDEVDEAKEKGKAPATLKKAVKGEKARSKVRPDMSLLVPDEDDEHEEAESPEFEAGEREGAKEGKEPGEKKKDRHITISRAKNGGYIAHHKHNHPHEDEMYHLKDEDELMQHMHEHMNEDEDEAI